MAFLAGTHAPRRAGMAAGVVRESAGLLVPRSFQNSQTYTVLVRQMLDFLAQDVGRVKSSTPQDPARASENFVARKAVGNFLEMASLATFHLSR